MYGQKIHLEYIRDRSNHQLDMPIEKRSEIFCQLLNGYYVNCKWMKKLCSRYHRSFKFFREFCSNYFDIFTRDIKPYKQNFLVDELPPEYDNRRKYFKRLIKSYCLMSMMLLENKERTVITVILDRFHFETQRSTESDRRMMMSAF